MAACGVGARIWVPHEGGWAQAYVKACQGSQLLVRRDVDGEEVQLNGTQAFLCNNDDVEDMTSLAFLHEPGVLWNLQSRYQQCEIYTYTGSILIAVNPFKPVPHLYGTGVIERYRTLPREQLPPHVYATACTAYRNMMRDGSGQAILVTGESGAGKTETAKLIMACLTHLGALHSSRSSGGGASSMSGVEQKILESNPLLEAFGNAKTLRNNNSSRFGKYVEIFFDPAAGGAVTGAAVRTYLLERSRVVAVNNPERSFHIFYQLVYGASPEDRAAWRLPDTAAGFAYLVRSSCVDLPGQSNAEEYQHTRRAMSHIGLSDEQQSAVLATVAAVLHLGNIVFVNAEEAVGAGSSGGRGEGAAVAAGAGRAALEAAAELLGVDPGSLEEALTTRQIQTPEGPIATPLSAQAATDARDSMAKVVYARLFDWLVAAINAAVDEAHNSNGGGSGSGGGGGPCSGHLSIGLLDIYGFESFEVNDLEQLCINLTNEKLQQHFNQHVFKWEQAEYEREGVDWSYISFRDNADVLELLEGRMGLMDLLDETCRFPKATAEDLAHKYGSSPAVSGSSRFTRLKRPATSFTVEHYAGAVTYSTLNLLEKNRDYVVAEHQSLLGRSRQPLLQELFAPDAPGSDGGNNTNGNGPGTGSGAGAGRNQFQFRSVATQCRRQLGELMAALSRLQPHYVRCIKPNPAGSAGAFTAPYSLQQLRCGGVMEAVRIACAGFAYRRPYAAFLEHFWQLCPEAVHDLRRRAAARQPRPQQTPAASAVTAAEAVVLADQDVTELRAAVQSVLAAVRLRSGSVGGSAGADGGSPPLHHLGHTKVFLRATAAAALERQRLAATNAAAATIQAHYRRLQVQHWYKAVRLAVITIQAHCRGFLARREAQRLRRERAATTIQRAWRGCVQRLRFLRLRSAAVVMQALWRGVLTRRSIEAIRQERAALIIQTVWRGLAVRREYQGVLRFWRAAVKVQAAWRGYAARQLYLQILPLHRTAVTLQRIWRSHRRGAQMAERLRTALLQYWIYSRAAVVIQAAWRGKVGRQQARRLRLQQRRARFLALANGFASEGGTSCQPGGCLPARLSPDAVRRPAMRTPSYGNRTYSHTLGGSAGKAFGGPMTLTPALSADNTPVAAGDVVRADDLASDRDSRMRARLMVLQDFKVSPLVQYWQHREAAAVDGSSQPAGRRAGSVTCPSRSRPGTAEGGRGNHQGMTHESPVRFMGSSPYGSMTPPPTRSPPDTDDRGLPIGRDGGRHHSVATTLDDATDMASRGASSTTFDDGTDVGSRGGSAVSVEEAVELSSGGLSCEPSYGQLLSYSRQEESEGQEVAAAAGGHDAGSQAVVIRA